MGMRFNLGKYDSQLWTRDKAREIRKVLIEELDSLKEGDTLVIDLKNVEVFDFSFANEFFGKTLQSLPSEYPGRFIVIENLKEYTRENLDIALKDLSLVAIERKAKKIKLLGKVNNILEDTFETIFKSKKPITAVMLGEKMDLKNINAVNERLNKLINLGLARRAKSTSKAGREQYEYETVS